jgi:hypothetical protein
MSLETYLLLLIATSNIGTLLIAAAFWKSKKEQA